MNADRVGRLIRLVRRERGMTQAEVALRLGIHVNTLSTWERGIAAPSLVMLGPLCAALNVEPALFADLPLRGWRRYLR